MEVLGQHASSPARVYFAGGATAVLIGWRETTIDVDMRIEPEVDQILRLIPQIKEDLQVNIEFATPMDFIPVASDWERRSLFIAARGQASFFHFDVYAQALGKLERGHTQDLADVTEMVRRGLIEPSGAMAYFESIEGQLFRFPAIDPETFRQSVFSFFEGMES